ncbi:hypothetical protein EI427_16715 [Flammeovirga pectinis]|uniref:Uncharacterized protein n=1 Tax=Flammeovirga pectinis TaxID=2494373 RepID=A0A3S9P6I6_9BACT|nr:hypothetical protein [Flammeovirga pectinis]AZQ63808.1 hypothetical protein EI427_16715 [Flammeovirga pectinis]
MKYSIPIKRKLKNEEYKLLEYLFKKEKKDFLDILPEIVVIGRCGCGKCPTIQFGLNYESDLIHGKNIIDYYGLSKNGNLIGVSILGNEYQPSELEFWSIDGVEEITEIPDITTLKPMDN